MNLYDYCEAVALELGNWRKKLTVLDLKIALLPSDDKEKMLGSIEEMHMIVAEMEDRIYNLEHSSPTSLRPLLSNGERIGPVLIDFEAVTRGEKADYDFRG
ncbi:MAG: hypothetical protein KKA54_02135 [Proteobacteria bacterium]|nr:hypothetical protein [Pseudomonadota bacterium]